MAQSLVTRRGFGALAAGLLAIVATSARPAEAQMAQVALTGDTVKAFIASFADVKKTAAQLSAKYGPQGGDDPTSAFSAWMAVAGAQSALNAAVQAHGFGDFGLWIQVLTSVATAYGFAKSGPQMDAGMADAIAQIKNNSSLSAAQKEMMLQQMQGATASMAAVKPSQANLDAVKPYLDQLAVVFAEN